MQEMVAVRSFCPNEKCLEYGQTMTSNIINYGKSSEYWRCTLIGVKMRLRMGSGIGQNETEAAIQHEINVFLCFQSATN